MIPPVVDSDPLDPDFTSARRRARAALGLNGQDEVIGWVGRFVEQKDPHTLARVLVSLLRTSPTSRAVLVGDGPQRDEVGRPRSRAAAVRERVTLTGVVDGCPAAHARPSTARSPQPLGGPAQLSSTRPSPSASRWSRRA